jgi:hypothetical protein
MEVAGYGRVHSNPRPDLATLTLVSSEAEEIPQNSAASKVEPTEWKGSKITVPVSQGQIQQQQLKGREQAVLTGAATGTSAAAAAAVDMIRQWISVNGRKRREVTFWSYKKNRRPRRLRPHQIHPRLHMFSFFLLFKKEWICVSFPLLDEKKTISSISFYFHHLVPK